MALVASLIFINSIQNEDRTRELAEVDVALPADELPPAAFPDPDSGPSANASSGVANHFLGTSEPIGRTCLACPGLEQQPSCSGCEACCKQTSQRISQTGVGRSHFGPATGFAAFGKKLGIPEKWTKVQMARNFPELPVSERRRQSQNAQQDVKMACFTTFEQRRKAQTC